MLYNLTPREISQELRARTWKQKLRQRTQTESFFLACSPQLAQHGLLNNSGPPSMEVGALTMSWALIVRSLCNKIPADPYDGGNTLSDIPFAQMTLGSVQLTKIVISSHLLHSAPLFFFSK